jgi:hypothetical protein
MWKARMWIGRVAGYEDPEKRGRVQVRIMGVHPDRGKLPDSDLPWIPCMMPNIFGGVSGQGTIPPPSLLTEAVVLGFSFDGAMAQENIVYGLVPNASVIHELAKNNQGANGGGFGGGSGGGGGSAGGSSSSSGSSQRVEPVGMSGDPVSGGKYDDIINEMAAKYGVDPALVKAIIKNESGFDQNAVSDAGAQGLMQLMPGTAKWLGVDPTDPRQNIEGGTKYIAQMLNNNNGNLEYALASYNWGPGNFKKFGWDARPNETRGYVNKVITSYNEYKGG